MAEFDRELDATGLNCPLPILRAKKALGDMERGQILKIIATDQGSVKDFDASLYMAPKDARKMDVFIQYGMAAATQAMEDSGLEVTEENAPRIGAAIGSGIGGANECF